MEVVTGFRSTESCRWAVGPYSRTAAVPLLPLNEEILLLFPSVFTVTTPV